MMKRLLVFLVAVLFYSAVGWFTGLVQAGNQFMDGGHFCLCIFLFSFSHSLWHGPYPFFVVEGDNAR